ncbi:thioesterase II family protein [Rheinheimera sp. WS51]|uniref:thioesterase II family protein n=1 Tax=Rheinheimera sp. WS51 TaxID=3425886 RepID=UPI003D91A02E
MYKNDWFIVPKVKPEAKIRLFCFPYAGGQAAIYFPLAKLLPDEIELVAVQLPGRGNRIFEPALTSASEIAQAVVPEILQFTDKPIALLGYSNGCLQTFEVANRLIPKCVVQHVFMAARSAPQLGMQREPIHLLSDQLFKQELASLGGTPKELLAYDELMELMLPTLRADFKLGYDYQCPPIKKLKVALTSMAGRHDKDIPIENVQAWQELFAADSKHHTVDGDHFFINTHINDMATIIGQALLNKCRNETMQELN